MQSRLHNIGVVDSEVGDDGMTVPELRAECRRRGLPAYQRNGKRLRKADLERQLYRRRERSHETPDAAIIRMLARLPIDPRDAEAMHRELRGVANAHERRHLDRRRLEAIRRLRDQQRAATVGWAAWNDLYNAECRVRLGGVSGAL